MKRSNWSTSSMFTSKLSGPTQVTHHIEQLEYVSHQTTIFGLKMMVKSGLDFFYFEILRAPSEIPANLPGQFSQYG